MAPLIAPPPPSWWPPAPGWWLLAALLPMLATGGWWWLRKAPRQPFSTESHQDDSTDSLRLAALQELAQLDKPQAGESASHWLQQLNTLLKRICRTRYPADNPHTMSGRTWLAFLDSRCPAAGLTRWMILVEGAYRAECKLDDQAIAGLEQAVETWIRKHA
nr:DUF4381 domain-containing protein [Azomonas macrocytogenes]